MKNRDEYVDYLVELIPPIGGVSSKRMFGGAGIFKDGKMFGLVADDVLYFKVDDINRDEFISLGLGPFQYDGKGKTMSLGYFRCPDEALESPAVMTQWAASGYAATLRAAARTSVKKSTPKPTGKRRVVATPPQ